MSYSLKSRFLKAWPTLSWVLLGQGASLIGSVASIKSLSFLLKAQEYGKLALGITIATFVNMLLFGPIFQSIVRFLPEHVQNQTLPTFMNVIQRVLGRALVFFFGGVILLIFLLWIFKLSQWHSLSILALVFGCLSALSGGSQMVLMFQERRKDFAAFQTLDIWLRFSLAVAFAWFFRSGILALIGYCFGSFVALLLQFQAVLRDPYFKSSWILAKRLSASAVTQRKEVEEKFWKYTLPFIWVGPLGFISLSLDRWLIQATLGTGEVGIYSALFQIVNTPAALIASFLTQVFTPLAFSKAGEMSNLNQLESGTRVVRRMLFVFLFLFLPVLPIAAVFHREIVLMLTTAEFASRSNLLTAIAVGAFFFQITQCSCVTALICKKTNSFLPPLLVKLSVMILASYFFYRDFGLLGICWAFATSNLAYFTATAFVQFRMVGELRGFFLRGRELGNLKQTVATSSNLA